MPPHSMMGLVHPSLGSPPLCGLVSALGRSRVYRPGAVFKVSAREGQPWFSSVVRAFCSSEGLVFTPLGQIFLRLRPKRTSLGAPLLCALSCARSCGAVVAPSVVGSLRAHF